MKVQRIPTRVPNDTVCHSVAYLDMLQRERFATPDGWRDFILNRYVRPLRERYFGDEPQDGYRVTAEPVDYGEVGIAIAFCIRPQLDPRWKEGVS